jgi:ATP-binding cassette subfamily B protein
LDTDAAARRAGWRLMRHAVRPYALTVGLGILSGLLWAVARVSVPIFARHAVDHGIVAGDSGQIRRWTALIVFAGVVQALATGGRRYTAFRMAHRVETDLRLRLVGHLQRLHFAFHDHAHTGKLMANAQTDIQQVFLVLLLIPLTIASSLTGLLVIVILMKTSVTLALFALGALPILNIAATRFTARMAPVGLALQEELGQLSGVVSETVVGIRAVKGFGAERLQMERLEREAGDVYDLSMVAARLRAGFLPLVDMLPVVGLVGILWWGGHQIVAGHLSIGTVIEANSYVLLLIWPLRMLGMLLGQVSRAVASAGRIASILATEPEIRERSHPRPLPPGGGEVVFDGVRFSYGGGAAVLDGLDLTIRAGEAVALVGATGSGKSTVARLLPRFYDVDEGSVRIDGVDVRDLSVPELRRSVSIVFEDTFLFSDSVRANIAFADPDAPSVAVDRAARLAGAAEFVEDLPDGYETIVGEQGFSLSGGQRQRIAIARAILADPRVLVLDDATSAVDPTKEHEIRGALEQVMTGRTTIVIAHRPATIALADRVVLLDGGRVAATGTHDELLATSARYREVLARAEADTPVAESAAVETPLGDH